MSTATPVRVESFPPIMENAEARDELRDGLLTAVASVHVRAIKKVLAANDTHPAGFEWDRLAERAVDEILPYAAAMLDTAIARRLPWEYER